MYSLYIYREPKCAKRRRKYSLNSYLRAPPMARSFLFKPCGAAKQKCFEINTTESGGIKAHHNTNRGGKFRLKCRESARRTNASGRAVGEGPKKERSRGYPEFNMGLKLYNGYLTCIYNHTRNKNVIQRGFFCTFFFFLQYALWEYFSTAVCL